MLKTVALAASVASLAPVAHAEVIGAFVLQGTVEYIDGLTPANMDLITFDVTNNTSATIAGFGVDSLDNIAFTGTFLNATIPALSTLPLQVDPIGEPLGASGALVEDTFFIGSGDIVAPGLLDSASELSADFVGSTGLTIAPGETKSIAAFSVPVGTSVAGGFGAAAVTDDGQIAGRIALVPEPASIALLASGLGLAGLRRRSS